MEIRLNNSIATGAYEGDPLEQGDTPTSVSQVTATTFAKGCEEQEIEAVHRLLLLIL